MKYEIVDSPLSLTIGERIAILRKRVGMTRTEFAQMLGVSYTTIANYENNKSMPSICRVSQMAVMLGTTMNMILHGYEPEKNEDFAL